MDTDPEIEYDPVNWWIHYDPQFPHYRGGLTKSKNQDNQDYRDYRDYQNYQNYRDYRDYQHYQENKVTQVARFNKNQINKSKFLRVYF
jgi:hypothetical protein